MTKCYSPSFYKAVVEHDFWEPSAEEVYWDDYKAQEAYLEYKKDIDDTFKKLIKLSKDDKRDSQEFKELFKHLKDVAPELVNSL